jgi:hypothetical protein
MVCVCKCRASSIRIFGIWCIPGGGGGGGGGGCVDDWRLVVDVVDMHADSSLLTLEDDGADAVDIMASRQSISFSSVPLKLSSHPPSRHPNPVMLHVDSAS